MRTGLRWCVGVAVVLIALVWYQWYQRTDAAKAADEPAAETARGKVKETGRRVGPAAAASQAADEEAEDAEAKDDAGKKDDEEMPEEEPKTEEEIMADREEALVDAFDGMTDKWQEPSESDVPMAEVEKFRQQFNKIPKARQEECLQRALNLLPDENIMLLAGILLDKEQPAEYLELVYNDILNRDESVKKPLLQEIYKDKEHPCWSTTAWILEATGESPGK